MQQTQTFEYYKLHRSEFGKDFKEACNSKEMRGRVPHHVRISNLASIIIWSKDGSKLVESTIAAINGQAKPFKLSDETEYRVINTYQQIKLNNKPINKLKNYLKKAFLFPISMLSPTSYDMF